VAKQSGITMAVSVDDSAGTLRNISNDVLSVTFNTPRGVQDVTGLDKSGMERILLLADGQVTINCAYNTLASTGSHTVLKTIPSNSNNRTVTLTPLGGSALSMEMVGTDYSVNRAQDGSLTSAATFQLADGAVPTWS
jgi:hypothetical protein